MTSSAEGFYVPSEEELREESARSLFFLAADLRRALDLCRTLLEKHLQAVEKMPMGE